MGLLNFKSDRLPSNFPQEGEGVRERIFLEHYSSLTDRALQFTRGQRERAEDLVHDTFVQFQIKQLEIAAIEDVRSYLSGMLRNLYLLQVRRAARHPIQQLSLLDHDSADLGLRAQSPLDHFQSADLLVRACRFVCHRKETSVPSSILILRFFHGYYTDEICRITGAQRRQVNKWLARGRNEAKNFLAKPNSLLDQELSGVALAPKTPRGFLAHLRRMIFDSCSTPCTVLETGEETNDTQALAHLVSCPKCLERRSRGCRLPSVAERMMDDISSGEDGLPGGPIEMKGKGPHQRSRGRLSSETRIRRACRERIRELYEHHPCELSIAFDGETHATLMLNAAVNTLNLSLEQRQCPDSLAILSEQEVCLLVLDHKEIESSERKVYAIPFSDGRSLEVVVVPEFRGPSIHVAYRDPELAGAHGTVLSEVSGGAQEGVSLLSAAASSASATTSIRKWTSRILGYFSKFKIPAMNPSLATALVLAVVASVMLVVGLWQQRRQKTVADLIEHATGADPSLRSAAKPGVIYQKVAIRTPRRTLERALYRDAQGVRGARRQQLSPQDEQLKSKLAAAGVSWDAPLSAIDYMEWRRRSGATRDTVTHSGPHRLTLTTTPVATGAVVKETLTLRDTDFHAVDRTIELGDSDTVEIAELSFDVLPWSNVNQDWFEPLSGQTATDVPGILPALAIHAPHVLSDLELDETELEVRIALNQLHADAGERIRLSRSPKGVEVKGVVDTDARKQELVSRLTQLKYVQTSILSVEEVSNQLQTDAPFKGSQPIHVYSVEAQPSPLEQYLRIRKLPADQQASIAHTLLDGGLKVQQAYAHFSELQLRFKEADRLSVELQNQLRELSRTYLETAEAGLDSNEHVLRSLDLDNLNQTASANSSSTDEDLTNQIDRYQDLCRELIAGGAEQSRQATAIAGELLITETQIRVGLARVWATIPQTHD